MLKDILKENFILGARCPQNKFKDHLLTTPRPDPPLGSDPTTTGGPLFRPFSHLIRSIKAVHVYVEGDRSIVVCRLIECEHLGNIRLKNIKRYEEAW